MKKIFIIVLTFVVIAFIYACNWKSPSVNWKSKSSAWECIHKDSSKKQLILGKFIVNFVENSSINCINPYFPVVEINTNEKHNAWLHIVYTDSKQDSLKVFIDTIDTPKDNSLYPFYSMENIFYDTPIWTYTLFSKPLSFWKGHAWAVLVNKKNKTINPIGGIAWGFKLSYLKLRPYMLTPFLLNEDDWSNDWKIFNKELKGYKIKPF